MTADSVVFFFICWGAAASTLFVIWIRRDVGFNWTGMPGSPFTLASASVAFTSAAMSEGSQPQAFVGDVQLFDGHLARLRVQLRAGHLGG